jgi:hypothetical protein
MGNGSLTSQIPILGSPPSGKPQADIDRHALNFSGNATAETRRGALTSPCAGGPKCGPRPHRDPLYAMTAT